MGYKLDRRKLVEYYPTVLFQMINKEQIIDDIIKGSEFVVTAKDLLEKVEWVHGVLVGEKGPIHHSKIELTYQ